MNSNQRARCSIRLGGYDYSRDGGYFVTVCTQGRVCLFGEVKDGEIHLNEAGRMVQRIWQELRERFPSLVLDQFEVMPNHVHGVILLSNPDDRRGESCIRPSTHEGDHKDRPYARSGRDIHRQQPEGTKAGSVGRIVQAFKSISTTEYIHGVKQLGWTPFPDRLWQRNYYDHIIRNDQDLDAIRAYIVRNPARWARDEENPTRVAP